MATVLDELKVNLELTASDFDAQVVQTASSGLVYLAGQGIPVGPITATTVPEEWLGLRDEDYAIIRDWLTYYVRMRLDNTAGFPSMLSMPQNFYQTYMDDTLWLLKVRYDHGGQA